MRFRTLVPILSLLLSACAGNSSTTVPSPAAPAVRQDASGNPWVFVTAISPDPHIATTEVLAFAPAARYGNPIKIKNSIRNAEQIATDTLGNLFVLDYGPPSSSSTEPSLVRIFSPPYTGMPKTLAIKNVVYLALDRSNDLFLDKGDEILVLKPPYDTVAQKFAVPAFSDQFALDSTGDAFVSTPRGVNEYSPPSYALSATLTVAKGCSTVVQGVSGAVRVFVGKYCPWGGSTTTPYRIVSGQFDRTQPPLKTCDPAASAVSPTGFVVVSTDCGLLKMSPYLTSASKLNAFGNFRGVPVVGHGDVLYFGGAVNGKNGSWLMISHPPYSGLEQTVQIDPQNYAYSIALWPRS